MSDAWEVETVEDDDQKELEKFVYELIAERDRYRLKLGTAEGVIEEVKAFAENVKGGRPVRTEWVAERLEEILNWPDSIPPYDQSWRKKFYPKVEE